MTLWGWVCLGLVALICLFATMGCTPPVKLATFTANCAIAVIGKTEEGVTVVRQYCEVE